jgi:hypothetical protein
MPKRRMPTTKAVTGGLTQASSPDGCRQMRRSTLQLGFWHRRLHRCLLLGRIRLSGEVSLVDEKDARRTVVCTATQRRNASTAF